MIETAHIFTPSNDSLAERIKAYERVVELMRNTEKSSDDLMTARPENTYHVGTMDELDSAHAIAQSSLQKATSEISIGDIQDALEEGLITMDQATDFMRYHQQAEASDFRSNKRENQNKNQFKQ